MPTKALIKAARKNGKLGGRPKGAVSDEKKAQQEAFKELKLTILKSQDSLLRSQLGVAKGTHIILKIKKGCKPEMVTKKDEAIEVMSRQENGVYIDDESTMYILTLEKPDAKAIDSLLDRVHGRARQNIGLDGGEDDKPIAIKTVEEELKSWANNK